VELAGCTLASGGDAGHTIAAGASLIVAPGQTLLFARNGVAAQNGGLAPDYVYGGISLGNGADSLSLTCAGALVDAVAWDGGPVFPNPNGASMALDPGALDAADNDDGGAWCLGAAPYGDGDLGTPGAPNPPCPGPDPCDGVTCDTAPPGACDGTVAIAYAAQGACVDGACVHPPTQVTDCADAGLLCEGGACTEDPCVPNPCATPPAASCDGDVLVDHVGVGSCQTVAGSASCTYADKPFDCAAFGGTCAAGDCVGVAVTPGPGDLVIVELMVNPESAGDDEGEWFEVASAAGGVVDLAGCVLRDKQDDDHVVAGSGPFLLLPGERALFGGSPTPELNGGYTPDYAYGGAVSLANEVDELRLVCADLLIDEVVYDAATWPLRPGRSMQLDPAAVDAADNDSPASWCAAFSPYGDGDFGTPGGANPPCPTPNPVDRCRLDEPGTAAILKGQSASFSGTLREAGLTDLSGGTDPSPLVLVEVGTGPAGSNPSLDATGWTLKAAAPDASWDGPSAGAPTDDRYAATLAGAKAGSLDVALRVSVDGGQSWTWCDRDAQVPGADGSEDGYQPAWAGKLEVAATPCDPNPCTSPPTPTCDGDALITHPTPGACAIASGLGVCTYADLPVDCAALGGACASGACVGTASAPLPGEVAIVEILVDPAKVSDQSGEWLELANVADHAVVLDGCVLEDLVGGESHLLAPQTPLLLQPGGVALLGRSTDALKNGGVTVDYAYGNAFLLANTVDAVILRCDGAIVTRVDYDDDQWPFGPGVAMQLDPSAFGAPGAALPDAWCAAYTAFGAGDLGSPGAPNPPCPKASLPDWCRLQVDQPITAFAGAAVSVSGLVRKLGVTSLSAATDPNPLLLGQVGYGPQGSNPELLGASWTFLPATPDLAWLDTAEPGADAYIATFPAPDAGVRDLAFRFSVNGGLSWLYCDRATGAAGEDGSEDGYQPANAGRLTTTTGPCDPNPCVAPPEPTCAGDVLTSYASPGACAVVLGAATCAYTPSETNCAAAGGSCAVSACVGTAEPPEVGAVVVTELLRDPVAVGDDVGEWIELRNVGALTVDLWGCELRDDGGELHVIDPGGPLLIAPGQRLVLGQSDLPADNGGVAVDYVYGGLTLANTTADEVVLDCAGETIDRVAWASTGWPKSAGKAMQLDPGATSADQNDDAASWCSATQPYGQGDLGTPGDENTACPVDPCAGLVCDAAPAPDCSGGVARTFAPGGVCSAGLCTWTVATSVDCTEDGLVCLDGGCVSPGETPAAGEVLVTELMARPVSAPGADGQWIELSSTVDAPLLLTGCALESAGDAPWAFPAGTVLPAGGRLVLATSTDPTQSGGVAASLAYGAALTLDAEGDSVALTCGATLIDGVGFDALSWPWASGRALSLDPGAADAVANDEPASWCLATTGYGAGDLGSPGEANPPCPPAKPIDRCRLEGPLETVLPAGEKTLIAARYFHAGLTDLSVLTEADPRVVVQLALGPDGSDPATELDLWTLTDASADGLWLDDAEPGFDQALGVLTAPAPGLWRYAFRASVDAGQTFVWCDAAAGPGQDGSEDGFQPDLAGRLTALTPAGQAAPGDVIFTEIMSDPLATTDVNGEWVELTLVGPSPVDLSGCTLQSDSDADRVISPGVPLMATPGVPLVLTRRASPDVNGGITPAWAWLTGLTLSNDTDGVRLICGGQLIDAVSWDGGPEFPATPGAAMQLRPTAMSAAANDLGASWCAAAEPFGGGDLGSPGAPNPGCL
jgi:hypothetical protein